MTLYTTLSCDFFLTTAFITGSHIFYTYDKTKPQDKDQSSRVVRKGNTTIIGSVMLVPEAEAEVQSGMEGLNQLEAARISDRPTQAGTAWAGSLDQLGELGIIYSANTK
ncbi:hypothetical protein BJ878DRAFT_543248 [Calycina marina]|uniref:Uncharacterized protein n=1 Tax=Calycina marina TaxID=1763456 RepID=A0A9P7Z114_9HELO|nr:hypothetical protein BJ878DRAFT_543248 [Calycina marina]